MIYTTYYQSPIGKLVLAEREESLIGLWMEGQKYFFGTLHDEVQEVAHFPVLRQAKQWLDRYFAGQKPSINELPLAPVGSRFRKEVWKILCEIPYIEVTKNNLEKLIPAGRGRWKIENKGFNNQKNGIYKIEHLNSRDATAMKNHYLLTRTSIVRKIGKLVMNYRQY